MVIIRGFMTAEDEKCKQMDNARRTKRREKPRHNTRKDPGEY